MKLNACLPVGKRKQLAVFGGCDVRKGGANELKLEETGVVVESK